MKITDLRFNSRSLCGERSGCCTLFASLCSFQFSLPVRGAYRKLYKERTCSNVSILAPCAGSVSYCLESSDKFLRFNSRSLCGERTCSNSSSHHIGLPEQVSKLQNLCLGVSSPFSQFLPDNQRLSNGNSRTLLKMRFLHQPLDQFQRAIGST